MFMKLEVVQFSAQQVSRKNGSIIMDMIICTTVAQILMMDICVVIRTIISIRNELR